MTPSVMSHSVHVARIQLIYKMGNKQTVFTEEQLDNYVVSTFQKK